MYTIDNGSNAGWGDVPVDAQGNRTTAATAGNATNRVNEPGATTPDNLHLVQGPGFYAGHPNPTRANLNNKFNGSNPQSPVASANAVEGYFRAIGTEDGSLATFGASTNGLAEYTAANFGGSMAGDLLAASFDNTIYRIKLNAAGDAVASKTALFSNVGAVPLDVTTGVGALAGTIWVADYQQRHRRLRAQRLQRPGPDVHRRLRPQAGRGQRRLQQRRRDRQRHQPRLRRRRAARLGPRLHLGPQRPQRRQRHPARCGRPLRDRRVQRQGHRAARPATAGTTTPPARAGCWASGSPA